MPSSASIERSTKRCSPIADTSYFVPAASAEAEFREKKSRFLAILTPVAAPPSAQEALAGIRGRYPDASHHCWAWRLGAIAEERSSDDGEPAGTAGLPILQVLRGAQLCDVLVVVVRWFGGIKLGKGGLVRAYGEASRRVLAQARRIERFPIELLSLEVPYASVGAVKRLVHPPEVELTEESYGEKAHMVLSVRRSRLEAFRESLAELRIVPEESSPEGPAG